MAVLRSFNHATWSTGWGSTAGIVERETCELLNDVADPNAKKAYLRVVLRDVPSPGKRP